MHMIGHQTVRIDLYGVFDLHLREIGNIVVEVFRLNENRLAVMTPLHDVQRHIGQE